MCSPDERKVDVMMLYMCARIGNRSKAMNMEVEGDISPSPKSPPSKDIMMRVQCVPKANSTFAMACGGRLMVIEGQDLRHREV